MLVIEFVTKYIFIGWFRSLPKIEDGQMAAEELAELLNAVGT